MELSCLFVCLFTVATHQSIVNPFRKTSLSSWIFTNSWICFPEVFLFKKFRKTMKNGKGKKLGTLELVHDVFVGKFIQRESSNIRSMLESKSLSVVRLLGKMFSINHWTLSRLLLPHLSTWKKCSDTNFYFEFISFFVLVFFLFVFFLYFFQQTEKKKKFLFIF